MRERRAWVAGVVGTAAGAVVAGGVACAASVPPASNVQGTVCVASNSSMRFVASSTPCRRGERRSTVGWSARGTWSPTATYLPGHVVLRPTGSYVSRTTNRNRAPETSTSSWTKIAAVPTTVENATNAVNASNAASAANAANAAALGGLPATAYQQAATLLSATVAPASAAAAITSGRGATAVTRLATGFYQVTFNRNLAGCTGIATYGKPLDGSNVDAKFATVRGPSGSAPQAMGVVIRDSAGTQADGDGFHVLVLCP